MRAICLSLCWPEENCIASVRPPLDEYHQYIERMRPWAPLPAGNGGGADGSGYHFHSPRPGRSAYEVFHGVKIQDQALIAAATLSKPLYHRPLFAG